MKGYETMIQKITEIKEENKFEDVVEYNLLGRNQAISCYLKSLIILKNLIEEYPNCLEKSVIEDMLNQVKEKGRRSNRRPNSYSHYHDECRVEGKREKYYVKIGCIHPYTYELVNIRDIPIRIHRYGICGNYVDCRIVDFNYNQEEDKLDCIGISLTEPGGTMLKTEVMTGEEIIRNGMNPVELKYILKEN